MIDLACGVIRISIKCSCLEIFDQQGNPNLTPLVVDFLILSPSHQAELPSWPTKPPSRAAGFDGAELPYTSSRAESMSAEPRPRLQHASVLGRNAQGPRSFHGPVQRSKPDPTLRLLRRTLTKTLIWCTAAADADDAIPSASDNSMWRPPPSFRRFAFFGVAIPTSMLTSTRLFL